MAKLNGAYLRPFRRITNLYVDSEGQTVPGHEVVNAACILPLEDALTLERLRFFKRVLHHAPPFLRCALDADDIWKRCIIQDEPWLWKVTSNMSHHTLADEDAARRVVDIFRLPGKQAGNLIRRAAKDLKTRHKDFNYYTHEPQAPALLIQCPECGHACKGTPGLRLHETRSHSLRSPFSLFVHDVHCIACLKLFHSRIRVLSHVGHSATCVRQLPSR